MTNPLQAALAYAANSAHRNPRDQEADVFRRANAAMRLARDSTPQARVRALADNKTLWLTVLGLVRDPDNRLPAPLRASIVSVGLAVQREMDAPSPDFDFLVTINENLASGLAGAQQ